MTIQVLSTINSLYLQRYIISNTGNAEGTEKTSFEPRVKADKADLTW